MRSDLAGELTRWFQSPDAENRTSGGVGGCRGAIPFTRPDSHSHLPFPGLPGFDLCCDTADEDNARPAAVVAERRSLYHQGALHCAGGPHSSLLSTVTSAAAV